MKKNEKKIKSKTKKLLEFLVQEFFEVDVPRLMASIDDNNMINEYWGNIIAVLIGDEFWMDESDPEEMRNTNLLK